MEFFVLLASLLLAITMSFLVIDLLKPIIAPRLFGDLGRLKSVGIWVSGLVPNIRTTRACSSCELGPASNSGG